MEDIGGSLGPVEDKFKNLSLPPISIAECDLTQSLMVIETNEKPYYRVENLHSPDWWDAWLKRNLKKKARALSKRLKQD